MTGTKTGYTTETETSAPTAPIAPAAFTKTPTPIVKGAPKVGSTLSGSTGTWTPAPTTVNYQWYANGIPVSGATSTKYRLTTAEAGTTITFAVTGSRAGYTTVRVVSTPTVTVTN